MQNTFARFFHQHIFIEVEDTIDNMFECSCKLRLRFETDVTQETVNLIKTPGWDLKSLPGGTEGEFIGITGEKIPFRIATDQELLERAKEAKAFFQAQIDELETKLSLNEDEEWAEVIGGEDEE